jgi:hypothetical protein
MRLNRLVRQHWGIENKLHWVLDAGFGEDLSRKRSGHSAQNFSLLNRMALDMRKQEKTSKRGIKGKRLNAAWDHPYLQTARNLICVGPDLYPPRQLTFPPNFRAAIILPPP